MYIHFLMQILKTKGKSFVIIAGSQKLVKWKNYILWWTYQVHTSDSLWSDSLWTKLSYKKGGSSYRVPSIE